MTHEELCDALYDHIKRSGPSSMNSCVLAITEEWSSVAIALKDLRVSGRVRIAQDVESIYAGIARWEVRDAE